MAIQQRFEQLEPFLDERSRRVFAAAEANCIGHGGVSLLATITGLARSTIRRGQLELAGTPPLPSGRIRRGGGGRKKASVIDVALTTDLEKLVEPLARGDPMSPLRWTCKSVRTLSAALKKKGHEASPWLVWSLLRGMKYSLQSNRKTKEGNQHPDYSAHRN